MRFRTEIEIPASGFVIDHGRRGFIAGSCFSEHISKRLTQGKFPVTANPTGILFNPLSIADMLHRLQQQRMYVVGDLHRAEGMWVSYDHHSCFSRSTPEEALAVINAGMERGAKALEMADYVILTWGTAWIYRLAGTERTVANCHKQPAACFIRNRLSVSDIVNGYIDLLEGPLAGKQVLLTVSPVRHLKDGFDGNSLSKALLRTAVSELVEKFPNTFYFPSFEIMNDDLRDYRFYAEDMVHPSQQAVDYIWEKFTAYSMDKPTRELLPKLGKLYSALSHRIMNENSMAVVKFANNALALISEIQEQLPSINFSSEREYFDSLAAGL